MPDRVGQQLGNYRLVRMLGRGGFADVYLGEHVHLETEAAVKVLHTQLADADITSFQREAQTIAKLAHPHIVRVLDFAVQDGVPFLAMDYAPYGTLRQQHEQGKPLSLETVVAYVKQMADALQYAHDQKVVHRDIKPENMLVGRRKDLLLSDFGIAVVTQSSHYQTTQQMIGTVAYMAPEQIQGHPRPASDQYSLAVVVYEWLTGQRPFQGAITEVAMQQLVVPPAPLRDKLSSVPPAVEQVVLTALAKEPKERFGSMRAFANALEQASQIKAIYDFSTNFITPPQAGAPPGQATPLLSPLAPGGPATPRLPENGQPSPSMPAGSVAPGMPEGYATNLMPPPGMPSFLPPPSPSPVATSTGVSDAPTIRTAGPAAPISPGSPPSAGSEQTMWTASSGRGAPPGVYPAAQPPPVTPQGWYSSNAAPPDADYPPTWAPPVDRAPAPPPPARSQGGVSRRTVLLAGAGGLVVVAAGSTLAWYGLSHKQAIVQPTPTPRGTVGPTSTSTARPSPTTPPPPRGTLLVTYRGHRDFLNTVAWSPDGRRIASGSGNNNGDYTAQVWDAVSGATAVTYSRHSANVYSVAWSPDGRRIVSGSQDFTAQVWDASNGNYVLMYSGHSDAVYTVAWSPDGKHIASAGRDDTVQVWDSASASNSYTYSNHRSFVHSALWSKNSARIVSASGDDQADLDNSVQVWDALSGGNRVTYKEHPKPVIAVAWSPDNTRIASASLDQTIQVWQASNGALVLTLSGHSKGVGAVAWSPNGKYIASGSYDNTVNIWDVSSGSLLYTYTGHSAGVSAVAWSSDSQRVASGSFDQTVQVWQAV